MQSETLESWGAIFGWLPAWVIAGGAVILAILVGLWAHRVLVRVAWPAVRNARPIVRSLFNKTARPARLAFILLALWLVMPLMPAPGLGDVFSKLFMVAVIGLIGWAGMNAAEMGAELYLKGLDGKSDATAQTHERQVRVLKRSVDVVIVLVTAAFAMMTFETGRQIGLSLFAWAGLAGLVVAFAAYPAIKNLIAGVQLAMTQPIRIGDAVVVNGQTGEIEDITSSSAVMRLVDERRSIVPLYFFMEKPFENLTRDSSDIVTTISFQADYSTPIDHVRQKFTEIVKNDPLWNGKVAELQVTDANERGLELRATVSAATLRNAWDLRCSVREKLFATLLRDYAAVGPRRGRGPAVRVYLWNGVWVFDDPTAGRVREPFGTSDIIRRAVSNIPNAERGFLAVFSDAPSPKAQVVLDWVGESGDGNRYRWTETGLKDWLSPELTRYYEKAPKQLYIEIRALMP
jgi:small-conductance mechanosensitive channel